MKKIEIAKLSKDLLKEGITLELIEKVQNSEKISPVIFKQGEDPVIIIRCNEDFFWVQLEDGSYLKDEKKKLMKFDLKTCIIAHARYWLLFSEKETAIDDQRKQKAKEIEIQKEVEKIKADLTKQVKELTNKFKSIYRYVDIEAKGLDNILISIEKDNNPEIFQQKKEAAMKFIEENPTMEQFINALNEELKNNDFDSIYISLKTNGLPLLMSIKYDNDDDMEMAKKFFSANIIEKTIETINNKSHIETIAMLNVNRRYI